MIIELKDSGTNTYLIRGTNGSILFDAGWAVFFPQFCKALGEAEAQCRKYGTYLFPIFIQTTWELHRRLPAAV